MKCEVYLGPNLRERLLLSPIRVRMRVSPNCALSQEILATQTDRQ